MTDGLPMMTNNNVTRRPVSLRSLAAYTTQEVDQSQNWAGSEQRESIKQGLNYLLLRAKGDEIPDRSQLQSGDVADMVDHVQSEIQPMYSVDELCEIGAEGPDDEDQAALETEAVNWYFRERSRGFETLDSAVQDALLSRNGYLKVWYEETKGLPYEETLEGQPIQIGAAVEELSQENELELIEGAVLQEQVIEMVAVPDPMNLDDVVFVENEIQPEILQVKVKITPILREVKIASPAPEHMYISRDAVDTNMQKPRFVAQKRRMTRQDVAALGLRQEQVDRMTSVRAYESDVEVSRREDFNTYNRSAPHHSGDLVDLFECYYKIDRDGDGIPEMWKYFWSSNQEVMDWEERDENGDYISTAEMVRSRPFACGSPLKVAHRQAGRSLMDKTRQIEDTKRALIRQMVDNLYMGNDTGFVYGDGVRVEDLEDTGIPRYIYAAQGPGSVSPVPYNNTAEQSLLGIQYMDKVRQERGGSSITTSSEAIPVGQGGDHSLERMMSAMEKFVGMMARNLAGTLIRDTFVLLHQNLKLLPGKLNFQVKDDWQEVEPRLWIERNRISVNLGMSEGERLRRINGQSQVIGIQREDKAQESTLTSDMTEYESRIDLYRAMGLPNPEQYVVNPQSPEGQMAAQAKAQTAQQQQELAIMQQQSLIQAQTNAVAMQEETKRMGDATDALEKQRDRLSKMMIEFTKVAADLREAGIDADIPMSQLDVEDDEDLRYMQ